MRFLRLKSMIIALEIVGIAYFCFGISLRIWQNHLIFFPSSVVENSPRDYDLDYQDVWIPIQEQKQKTEYLHSWWIPNSTNSGDVLLYLHGNGENISSNLGHARRFHYLGYSVLLIDYRGYGRSQGQFPTESQVYADAEAAWDYLVQEKKVKPENILIYGHSLGGAIAINLAVQQPKARGVVVESSFTSMRDMVDYIGKYKFLPIDLILTQKFDSISKIQLLAMPILLIHGREDQTVPSWMSQALFEAAKVPKKLLIIPQADHNNAADVAGEKYLHTLRQFKQVNQESFSMSQQAQ